ncbi:DUF1269 domain-containing protein [Effusibacillus lacus]|uniref:DUF1269 domain-containing protein n=1 Tax=Effusibacillus lacus TaxID=1348429 RepID=UPI001E649AD8|nr:DUF1269 domain-containing protein [Effusibacillus lacus]
MIGSFEKRETAERVIETLTRHIPRDRISMITRKEDIPEQDAPPKTDLPIDGGLLGAAVGGAIGLAFVAGSAALPGGTPLMAGWGPLFGVLYGGMSGGVLGGLIDIGINPTSARTLTDDVESGKTLVSAEVENFEMEEVKKILNEFGADHIAVPDSL